MQVGGGSGATGTLRPASSEPQPAKHDQELRPKLRVRSPWGTLQSTLLFWLSALAMRPHSIPHRSPETQLHSPHVFKSSGWREAGELPLEGVAGRGAGWGSFLPAALPRKVEPLPPKRSDRDTIQPLYFYSHRVFWHFPENREETGWRAEAGGQEEG